MLSKAPHTLLVASVMSFGPVAALGLARFSYALLLPAMKAQEHWSYSTSGMLNVVNALGYLLGAATTASIAQHLGTKKLFYAALVGISIAVAAVGLSSSLVLILPLRLLSGIFGAYIFVSGGSLVARYSRDASFRVATASLGIFYGGAGLGTAISGAGIPALLSIVGPSHWKLGWLALGAACGGCLALTLVVAPYLVEPPHKDRSDGAKSSLGALRPAFWAYGLFGAGYISYMTFIIAYYRNLGRSTTFVAIFYVVLGLSSTVSAFVWNRPLGRLKRGNGMAITLAAVTIGSALPLFGAGTVLAFSSAVLFGLGLMAPTTAFTRVAQRNLAPHQLTAALGAATVFMAIGQSTGPLLSGVLSDAPSGLALGMGVAAGLVGVATLVSLLQKDQRSQSPLVAFNTPELTS